MTIVLKTAYKVTSEHGIVTTIEIEPHKRLQKRTEMTLENASVNISLDDFGIRVLFCLGRRHGFGSSQKMT